MQKCCLVECNNNAWLGISAYCELHWVEKNMKPHQLRVVEEKTGLDKKATALSNFIGCSDIFMTLDPAEQERLKVQNDIMWQYSEILGARIAAFAE